MKKQSSVSWRKRMAIVLLSVIMLFQMMPLAACAAEVSLPNISLPNVSLPEVSLPNVNLPNVNLPNVSLPNGSLSDGSLPDVNLPNTTLPGASPTDTSEPNSLSQGQSVQQANPLAVEEEKGSFLNGYFYRGLKTGLYTVGMSNGRLINEVLKADINPAGWNGNLVAYKYTGGLTRSLLGLVVPSDTYGKVALDTWQGVDYGADINRQFQTYRSLASGARRAESVSEVARGADAVTDVVNVVRPLSKLTTGLAVAGMVVSGGEGIYNGYKAFQADNTEDKWNYGMKGVGNLGQFMLSAAPLAAGCAPLALGLAVVGGALWGISAIYGNRKKIGEAAKWVGNAVKNSPVGKAVKGIANFAKGLFG